MNTMIVILFSLSLVGVLTYVLVTHLTKEPNPYGEPTIDEIVAQSFETEEITTNLLSNDFVKATFKIHVNSKQALQEIEKRDFQVKNTILRVLSGKEADELAGPEGLDSLEATVRDLLNELMQDGAVIQVYTTSWVIQ